MKTYEQVYLKGAVTSATASQGSFDRFKKLATAIIELRGVDGAVAECGCMRGLSTFIIASYLWMVDEKFDGTGMHVIDSFEGLSEPTSEDYKGSAEETERTKEMMVKGAFSASIDWVKLVTKDYPNIAFHKGWIPEVFIELPELQYKFVHLDVDLYAPTLASLNYFYPRLHPKGIMVCDDVMWPGARRAMEEFADKHNPDIGTTDEMQTIIRKK